MKYGAIYCIYDDHEYLELSIAPIADQLDRILFMVSDIPWNGSVEDNTATRDFIKDLASKYRNIEIISGHWTREHDQRNEALRLLGDTGVDYAFIIDTDEIYDPDHFLNIKEFIKQNSSMVVFHIEWNTYWKKGYYRIFPREKFKPIIAVKINQFVFTHLREGRSTVNSSAKDYPRGLIPPFVAICYHLSYARTDEKIKRKIETNMHAGGILPGWYEKVWLKWTPDMRNLHPLIPDQYRRAIPENLDTIPRHLRDFILMEKSKKKPAM